MYIEVGEQKLQLDSHETRMQSIRKQLANIKATDWLFDPIEKYIGQA